MAHTLEFTTEFSCSVEKLWRAWTTREGITSFFAPDCNIDLRVDGKYEVFFDLNNPYGLMGSEGMRIMAVEPNSLLSFTWNAPPSMPDIRNQRTQVALHFKKLSDASSQLVLINSGYGAGAQWQEAYNYFHNAWGKVVLPRLKDYLEGRPQVWPEE